MFNGRIGAAFARMTAQDFTLQARTAAGVSGTTEGLANALMALREDTQPIKEALMNIWNSVGTVAVKIAHGMTTILENVGFLSLLETIADVLEWFAGEKKKDDSEQRNFNHHIRELANVRLKERRASRRIRIRTQRKLLTYQREWGRGASSASPTASQYQLESQKEEHSIQRPSARPSVAAGSQSCLPLLQTCW